MTTTRRTTEIPVLDDKTVTVIGPWPQTDSATLSLYISTISARLDRDQAVKLRDALDKVLEADYLTAQDQAEREADKAAEAEEARLTEVHGKYRTGDLVIVADDAVAQLGDKFTYVEEEFLGKAANVTHADPANDPDHCPGATYYTDKRVVRVQLGDNETRYNFIHVGSLRNVSLEVREGTFPADEAAAHSPADEGPAWLRIGDEVTVDGRPAKVTALDPEDTMWPYAIEFTDRPGSDWVRPVNAGDLRVLTGEYPNAW